jgi:hypothetical protein
VSTERELELLAELKRRDETVRVLRNDLRRCREAQGALRLRVSEKGALSVYDVGRFPVTLYKEQWQRLLAEADSIRAFLKDNDAQLKTKGPAAPDVERRRRPR